MSLVGAQQKFSQARRKGMAKAGKGKLFSAIGDEAADFMGFAGEVIAPNLESWSELKAGQKAVGIEKNDMLKPSFWDKFTKKASDVYGPDSDRVMSESLGRSYSTGELQNIGALRQSGKTDLLAQVEATQGRSIEQIFGQAAGSGASSIEAIKPAAVHRPLTQSSQGDSKMTYNPERSTIEGAYGESFGLGKRKSMFGMAMGQSPTDVVSTDFKPTAVEPLEPQGSGKSIGSSEKSPNGPGSLAFNKGLLGALVKSGVLKKGQKLYEHPDYVKGMPAEDYMKIAATVNYEGPQ